MEQDPRSAGTDLLGLDLLEAWLSSSRAPEDAMELSELDGFLAGIAVGPQIIMPSEWLHFVWGDEPPVFEDAAEAEAMLGAIMARYNEIIHGLQDEEGILEPLFLTNETGEVIADLWAEGFLEAVGLRPTAWDPLFSHRDAGSLMMPILLLARGTDEFDLDVDEDRLDELLAEVPNMIAPCVVAIDRFWKTKRSRGRVPKIGRNAPCPCGSGRKYKLCCGRN
ncbi:UPF0149 family protein [Falsiroseomonas sp. HC035]|uniref:UPF0149 family protein n=1 Tax=Falsiroseomonas sp. HC035 TaxID=3390999 RepID=UPI003D3116E2